MEACSLLLHNRQTFHAFVDDSICSIDDCVQLQVNKQVWADSTMQGAAMRVPGEAAAPPVLDCIRDPQCLDPLPVYGCACMHCGPATCLLLPFLFFRSLTFQPNQASNQLRKLGADREVEHADLKALVITDSFIEQTTLQPACETQSASTRIDLHRSRCIIRREPRRRQRTFDRHIVNTMLFSLQSENL